MRILINSILFYPELIGIGKFSGEMAQYLSDAGHQVRVIAAQPYYPGWKVYPGYKSWKYQTEEWDDVRIFRSPLWVPAKPGSFKRLLLLFSFALSSFPTTLRQISWKPDVVIWVAPSILNAPSALILSFLSGAKTWLHIQDFELDAALDLGMIPAFSWMRRWAGSWERWLLSRFDKVSTISERMQIRLHQKGVLPERTILFPNWVDMSEIFPMAGTGEAFRSEFGIQADSIVVLYAGNMGHKQGLEYVVEAASRLEGIQELCFVFCGDGAVGADIKSAVSQLSNALFIPLQPYEKLNSLLNMADIHILPQRANVADLVMPSKLSGMLASGKPVVATAHMGTEVAEVVSQVGIVVQPEDSDLLAEAILNLTNDPDLRRSSGRDGVAWVAANWSKKMILCDFCESLGGFSKS